jgi:hypothetical protein
VSVVRWLVVVCTAVVTALVIPEVVEPGFNSADVIVLVAPFVFLAALWQRGDQTPAGDAATPLVSAFPHAASPAGSTSEESHVATIEKPTVTLDVARHVLHYFGDTNLGRTGGEFFDRLLATFAAVDRENRERLRSVYPVEMHAWETVLFEAWGMDWLRAIVKADLDDAERGIDFTAVNA